MPIKKKITWIEKEPEEEINDEDNDPEIDDILSEFPDDEPETEIPVPPKGDDRRSPPIEIPKPNIQSLGTVKDQPPEPMFKLSPLDKCLELTRNGLTIIAGSSEAGKTSLVLNLLRHNVKKFHRIWALCGTTDAQLSYRDVLPKRYIVTPTDEAVDQIVEEQRKNTKWSTLIILDDVIGRLKFHNSDTWDQLASSARHDNLTIIVVTQDLKTVSSTMRLNTKVLFVTRLKEHSLKACFEMSSGFSSFGDFKIWMDNICTDWNIVRFNLNSGYSKSNYEVFKTNGPPKPFKLIYK